VVIAQIALERAEADLAKVNRGADPVDLAGADREALSAQAALERAQSDLDRLQRGPDPADVTAAQREIERAQMNLRVARTTVASGSARAQRDAAIMTAEVGVRDAQARLDRLFQGPRAEDVAAARRNVEIASANLGIAQQRQAQVRRGPDKSAVTAASLAVDQARLAAEAAETRYQALQSGANPAQVSTAAGAVDSARANYVAAQARLEEINRRGTGVDALRAEDRASVAAAAVEKARQAATVDPEQKNAAALDLILIQKEVRELQSQVNELERQVADGSPKAPFTGQISAISVRPGDPIEPGQVVVSIARPSSPLVIVDLTDDLLDQLSEGQRATVRTDGEPTDARLQTIAISGTGGRVARIVTHEPLQRGGVGSPAQVSVILSHKDNVVLLPRKAVKSAGARRYVEQMEGTSRRLVDVQVGLSSGDDIEIVTGLMPGESVLVPA
jgi:multidrug resistance efflux pump